MHVIARRGRSGFSLIELMVVILIISILAGLILMVVTVVREQAVRAQTGNRLKGIIESCVSYREQRNAFPVLDGVLEPTDPREAMAYTGGLFELLCRHQEVSRVLFESPINTEKITRVPRLYDQIVADLNSGDDEACLNWASSFAFDWTAPPNASHLRLMAASRSPSLWGMKGGMAGHFDSHVIWLRMRDEARVGETLDTWGQVPVTGGIATTGASVIDWIYEWGDVFGEDPDDRYTPYRGSSTLCWVR